MSRTVLWSLRDCSLAAADGSSASACTLAGAASYTLSPALQAPPAKRERP